jgi:hypothetical protein
VYKMGLLDMVRDQVEDLISAFGEIVEVRLSSSDVLEVTFADGNVTRISGSVYRCGYVGTGPLALFTFLDKAGFKVTKEQVEQAKAPFSLRKALDSAGTEE